MEHTYTIQMKTIHTPGQYVLHGKFPTATDAHNWVIEHRESNGILRAEVWNIDNPNAPRLIEEVSQ